MAIRNIDAFYAELYRLSISDSGDDARKAGAMVRRLSKVELVRLLVDWHVYIPELVGNTKIVYDFERFILLSIERYY